MPAADELDLNWAQVYWTHQEMFGRAFTEDELVATLGTIAVDDLIEALSRFSCMVEGSHSLDASNQLRTLRRIGFEPEIVDQLEGLFDARQGGRPRVLFFPQQVVHLMRLAIRHGDRRPRDGFGGGALAGPFIRCIFGVTDLFGHELGRGTRADVRGFILRQLGLMSRQETLYLFGRYYELLVRLWPRVHNTGGVFEPAAAFQQHTGISLEEFFILGFAVYSRFLNHVDQPDEPQAFALEPAGYFETTKVVRAQWEPFFAMLARTPNQLRAALDTEDARYGPGIYRCHTFDRAPLVRLENGTVVPTSFASLERAVTEGAFWLLADAAEAKGLPREAFTSPFGAVFERFAQESLERIAAMESPPPASLRDFLYGPKRARALSSDMTFVYEGDAIFFEVVTGQPNVATVTRGDDVAFREDVRRLILKKAAQLRRCWNDVFLYGRLRFDGVANARIQRVWPILILIEGFPLMPPLYGEVVEKIRRDGWPRGAPALTLFDADELAALETLVETRGWHTLDIIARWKREAPALPMSNWLAEHVVGGIGHATWHEASFAELTDLVARTVFGKSIDEIENEHEG